MCMHLEGSLLSARRMRKRSEATRSAALDGPNRKKARRPCQSEGPLGGIGRGGPRGEPCGLRRIDGRERPPEGAPAPSLEVANCITIVLNSHKMSRVDGVEVEPTRPHAVTEAAPSA